MISQPLLMVLHDFLPSVLAGTELYVARIAPRLALTRPVHLLYTVQAPGEAQYHLRRGSFQGLPTWELVQNHPYQPLERACHDPALEQVLSTVLEQVRPSLVHIHHLSRLSLRLPTLARTHGARVVFTLHDYHLLCPSGGQRAAHPDGIRCDQPSLERCSVCFTAFQQREGRLEQLAHAFSRQLAAWTAWSPALPFELYRRLPTSGRTLLQRLNPPSPASAPELVLAGLQARRQAVQVLLQEVERLISPSEQVAKVFRSSGLTLPALEVLPNPAPAWESVPLPARASSWPLRLLFVGTLSPHKGAHVVLEALRTFPAEQVQLALIGALTGDAAYLAQLQRLAGPGVHFLGRRSPEEVQVQLCRCHVLVLGSLWEENAPLTVLEALSVGRPVLAPALGGLPELIQPEHNGLLYAPGDGNALAACVRRLLEEPDLLVKLAANAKPLLSLEAHLERLEQLYAELSAERVPEQAPSNPTQPDLAAVPMSPKPLAFPEVAASALPRPYASVIVLTYNGGALLREVLRAVLYQRTPWPFEVLVLDSSSEDSSLEGLASLLPPTEPDQPSPSLQLRIIPKVAFQHGRTRNLGARLARGPFVVYLVQDATPIGSDWLVSLVEGLAQTEAVGGYARQLARPEADEALRARIATWTPPGSAPVLRRLAPTERWELLSPQARLERAAFDDVCSVLRRDWLLTHPFEEVPFGEDLLWGMAQLRAGQALAYLPGAQVLHSHRRAFREDFQRARLEHRLLAHAVGLRTVPDVRGLLRSGLGLGVQSLRLPAETRRRLWAEWWGQTVAGWETRQKKSRRGGGG